MIILAIAAGVIGLALVLWMTTGSYYSRLFAEDHFREFHRALAFAIEVAKAAPSTPAEEDDMPDTASGASFVTSEGLAAAATFSQLDDGICVLHISLSQTGRMTTHAVGNRFGAFILMMLQGNKAQLAPYVSESGVRHLPFRLRSETVIVQGFDEAYAQYAANTRDVPYDYRPLKS